MTKENNNLARKWLQDNSWNLIITAVGLVVAWTLLNSRVGALENKLEKYPSEDYFNLKFETIEKRLDSLDESVRENR